MDCKTVINNIQTETFSDVLPFTTDSCNRPMPVKKESFITNSSKRRLRKKNNKKKYEITEKQSDQKFYEELHNDAVKTYFLNNPYALKFFGTDSIKMSNIFADQCISAIKHEKNK